MYNALYFRHIPIVCCSILFSLSPWAELRGQTFSIEANHFVLNGKPFRILSGEMHYPRIPREYWMDRMQKARAMGLNTICTYVFWNIHEPKPGHFDFSGNLDIAEYLRTAKRAGLHVILRPGPYVCSEWDLGGLPSWLLKEKDIKLRCMDRRYIKAVERYIKKLGQELAGLQVMNGGPIIMLQVENEYGSYGNDKEYLRTLQGMYRKAGFRVPFFTSDGGADYLLESGTLKNVLPVVNFGSGAQREFAALEKFRGGIPLMCGEYWCGWFTHWGDTTWGRSDMTKQSEDLRWMLQTGKSFNLYMFHGGTNFGWMAGANYSQTYEPDVTSYDYDAPLDESGRPTERFMMIRKLLEPSGAASLPPPLPVAVIKNLSWTGSASLFENLPQPVRLAQPKSMEELGQDYGFILYRTKLIGPKSGTLAVTDVHDFGLVFLNGAFIDTLDRTIHKNSIRLPETGGSSEVLDILVEAMGRVNFGQQLIDRKGITEHVTLRGVTLMNWEAYLLPMEASFRGRLRFGSSTPSGGRNFFRGSFDVDSVGDIYLDVSRWSKGVLWVNGHNLGRYWNRGPQQRLFLPGPWLKKGANEIMVFDLFLNQPQPIEFSSQLR